VYPQFKRRICALLARVPSFLNVGNHRQAATLSSADSAGEGKVVYTVGLAKLVFRDEASGSERPFWKCFSFLTWFSQLPE